MTLQNLRSFVEVYRARSISAAARNLDLTQPAVSGHISSLEAQVGRDLFLRKPRGVVPTAFADDLAAQIGDSLNRAEQAMARAQARSISLSGVVHIAGPPELMAERVAPSLRSLHASGLQIRVHLGGREALYRKLLDGEVDLAFTASTPGDPLLASERVGSERLIAVAAPLMADRVLRSDDPMAALTSEAVLAYDTDQPLIRLWQERNRLPPDRVSPAITAPDLRMLRALVETGIGWSVIPDYLCRAALAAGRLVRIPGPEGEPVNAFHLVWPKSALRHPRVAHARDVLLRAMEDSADAPPAGL